MSRSRCTEARELALSALGISHSSVKRECFSLEEDGSCKFSFYSNSGSPIGSAVVLPDDSVETV